MAKSHEDEPFSWWRAKVKTIKADFYLINYADWDDTYNEIVEKEFLRPPNPNPPLDAKDLTKKELAMPKELWDLNEEEKRDPILQKVRRLSCTCATRAQSLASNRAKCMSSIVYLSLVRSTAKATSLFGSPTAIWRVDLIGKPHQLSRHRE